MKSKGRTVRKTSSTTMRIKYRDVSRWQSTTLNKKESHLKIEILKLYFKI